jgi:hypothetical protein
MCGRFVLSLRFSSRPRNRKHTHTLRLEVFLQIHSTMALRRTVGPHSSASSTTATTATFRRGGGILCRGSVYIVTTGLNEALTPQPSSSLVLQVPRSLSRTNASSFTQLHEHKKRDLLSRTPSHQRLSHPGSSGPSTSLSTRRASASDWMAASDHPPPPISPVRALPHLSARHHLKHVAGTKGAPRVQQILLVQSVSAFSHPRSRKCVPPRCVLLPPLLLPLVHL